MAESTKSLLLFWICRMWCCCSGKRIGVSTSSRWTARTMHPNRATPYKFLRLPSEACISENAFVVDINRYHKIMATYRLTNMEDFPVIPYFGECFLDVLPVFWAFEYSSQRQLLGGALAIVVPTSPVVVSPYTEIAQSIQGSSGYGRYHKPTVPTIKPPDM